MPDQTQKEEGQPNPPKEGQESQPAQQTATPAPQFDWEKRYKESTKEFQKINAEREADKARIAELEQVREKWSKAEPILQKIANNQRILEVIDEEEGKTLSPNTPPMQVFEPLLEDRLQKRIGPIEKQLDEMRQATVNQRIETYRASRPEFDKKFDEEAQKYFRALLKEGFPVEDALDKSIHLKSIGEQKAAGKREALIELYQANVAAQSGGGASIPAGESPAPLSFEEEKIARNLNISPEKYREHKKKG